MPICSPLVRLRRPLRSARRAFTMMELLVVLGILALLAGLAISNVTKIFGGAQVQTVKLFVGQSMKTSLFSYKLAMGDYPSTAEGIQALITAPSGKGDRWAGPYIEGSKVPLDPWGQPYQYAWPGKHNKDIPDIWSKGDPAKPEDLGNWEKDAEAPK